MGKIKMMLEIILIVVTIIATVWGISNQLKLDTARANYPAVINYVTLNNAPQSVQTHATYTANALGVRIDYGTN